MAFILIGNKKVRLPKGQTDVEGFAKIVDSFYKMLTTTNQINGKKLTPEEITDLKFPPSLKTALITKPIKEPSYSESKNYYKKIRILLYCNILKY